VSPSAGISDTEGSADALWQAGDRIEALLNASSVHGVVARERAEELLREVTSLYGEGLARMLQILDGARVLDEPFWDRLVADEVVSGLLLIHGLHPYDVRTRVESALESVRPYLATHGGDVELLEVTDEGLVQLRMLGSCDGCPSSSVTLELAVESAVEAAAPEVTSIQVTSGAKAKPGGGAVAPLIPVSALRSRLGAETDGSVQGKAHWAPAPELAELAAGEVGGFSVSDIDLLVCRIGSDLFAFEDRCPRCELSMAGARLERRAGYPLGSGVLVCPTCRSHYDVRQAGAAIGPVDAFGSAGSVGPVGAGSVGSVDTVDLVNTIDPVGSRDGEGLHLSPLPLLLRDDVFSVALPARPQPAAI
jgi:Fe-S cluster biogenesis protein NfuA/nitrite reductase/ring-hydroxylating ferredoxin subunit